LVDAASLRDPPGLRRVSLLIIDFEISFFQNSGLDTRFSMAVRDRETRRRTVLRPLVWKRAWKTWGRW